MHDAAFSSLNSYNTDTGKYIGKAFHSNGINYATFWKASSSYVVDCGSNVNIVVTVGLSYVWHLFDASHTHIHFQPWYNITQNLDDTHGKYISKPHITYATFWKVTPRHYERQHPKTDHFITHRLPYYVLLCRVYTGKYDTHPARTCIYSSLWWLKRLMSQR